MMDRQQAVVDVVRVDPDVDNVASFIGADGTNPTLSSGRLSITLKNREQRKSDAQAIIDRLSAKLAQVTGITVYLQAVQDLQLSSQVSRTQYQYTIEDADPSELAAWAPQVLARLKQLPELTDVASDQQNGALQMTLVIDRDTASRLGITAQAIDDTLYDAFGQRPVSTIFTQLNLYRVILEVSPEYQSNPNGLSQIYMRSATGEAVPLSAFVHFERTQTAVSIAHEGQFPAVTLSFNLAPGAALGDAVQAIKDAVAGMGAPLGPARRLPGRRGRVRRLALDRAAAHPRRHRHRLHRARRALRELHPPHHHPLDAAVGGRGGLPGAADLPLRVLHHRAHRDRPPHRHRQEERHHDDRLRARGGARAGQVAARGDPSGLPAALPARS